MMPFIKQIFFFVCTAFVMSALHAQDTTGNCGFGIEADILAGRIVKHKIKAPIPPLSKALDINFIWQTTGKKDWHQRCHFPQVGIGIVYSDYGSDKVFGECVGVYPNIQIPLIKRKNLEWTLLMGNGLGYVTRKYQTTRPIDTLNSAIGSHVNDFALLATDIRYTLNKHVQLQLGANFTHISDAAIHQPNLGVNMVGGHIGFRYFLEGCRVKYRIKTVDKPIDRWLVSFRYSNAFTQSRTPGSPELPTYIAAGYVSKRWGGNHKIYFGGDYAFHEDTHQEQKYWGFKWDNRAHSWDGTALIGYEYMLGRLGLVAQAGVYYKQTYLKFDAIDEKIGGNYYIINKEHGAVKELFLSALLLTHGIVAEFAEFGLGVSF